MKQGKSELAKKAATLAKDCEAFAEQLELERGCLDVINEIVGLAVTNTKFIHINPDYQAHLEEFRVYVHAPDNSYQVENFVLLYRNSVYLNRNRINDGATPLQQLLDIEDKLIELIAEAKEKAEEVPSVEINSLEDLAMFTETYPFAGVASLSFHEIRAVNKNNVSEIENLAAAVESENYGLVGLVTPELIRGFEATVGGEA